MMQPVNDTHLQHQAFTDHQKISGNGETSTSPSKSVRSGNMLHLNEDVVTLSTDRSSILETPVNKKPSVQVTSPERKALRDSFSVYA
jgi:hypothetical protein